MIYAIAAVLVLIADQWLKYWVTVNVAWTPRPSPSYPACSTL